MAWKLFLFSFIENKPGQFSLDDSNVMVEIYSCSVALHGNGREFSINEVKYV